MLPTLKNIKKAKEFIFSKWKERALEKNKPEPTNLDNACKFASLFALEIFGGKLRGNSEHQWIEINGIIIDLTDNNTNYEHDDDFWMNEEHAESLESCMPRVEDWVKIFLKQEE